MYFILLKQAARLQDVVLLKNQAYQAENRDLSLAKQLWKRVVAAVGYDSEAFEAIERIAVRISRSGENISITPENPSPNLSPARGEALNSPPSLVGKGAGGLGSFQFEVITVNFQGEEIKREKHQAEYFSEDLGDGVNLDMVYIPAGKFMMGSPEEEGYKTTKNHNMK